MAALGLAIATDGLTSVAPGAADAAGGQTPAWMVVAAAGCEPGIIEDLLNGWLESSDRYEFESELAAVAFDKLVELASVARDMAQDLCV